MRVASRGHDCLWSLMADSKGGILWRPHFYDLGGSLSPRGPVLGSWHDLEFLPVLT